MEELYDALKVNAKEIITSEKKNMVPLTIEELEYYKTQKVCSQM